MTFSVTSRDCAISQLTFSHGIANNFGVDHSSGYLLQKRNTQPGKEGKISRQQFVRTSMQHKQDGKLSHLTKQYSNHNIIHPTLKTRFGELGIIANIKYLSKNIDKISALGNESCICYKMYYGMRDNVRLTHMALNESCKFTSAKMILPFIKPKKNVLAFTVEETKKKDKTQEIRNQKPHCKEHLYANFLNERKNLFTKYLKAAHELYKTYLEDAHKKFHERGHNFVYLLGNGD